jgi:hypothetical protein
MMKKMMVSAALLLATCTGAFAQKGSILLYGNIEGSRNSTNGTLNNSSFNFNPGIGYQFDDNFTAGLNLNYETMDPNSTTTNSMFTAGPFVRYSKMVTPLFSAFGQLDANFGTGTNKVGTTSADYGVTNIGFTPAISMHIKKGLCLNFNVGGINLNSTKPQGGVSSSDFGYNFGRSIVIGLSKNFSSYAPATK